MNIWIKLQSIALASSSIVILLLVRGSGHNAPGACAGPANAYPELAAGLLTLARASRPKTTPLASSRATRLPASILDARWPLPRTFTRDAKVRIDIQKLLKFDQAFVAANPDLTLDDFVNDRVTYSDIRIPPGTPLVAATDPSCVVPLGKNGDDASGAPTGLTLQTYDIGPGMTVQDLIYDTRGDSCIAGLYVQGAVPADALEPRVHAVASVLPLSDQVKALAKADVLEKAMEDGTSPELVVAAIHVAGAGNATSTPSESSREMTVRNPLAADDPSQSPTATITVTRTRYSVPASQGQQPRLDQLSSAITAAVDRGARLIGVPPGSSSRQIQSALDYAAAHGAQVVTLPSS